MGHNCSKNIGNGQRNIIVVKQCLTPILAIFQLYRDINRVTSSNIMYCMYCYLYIIIYTDVNNTSFPVKEKRNFTLAIVRTIWWLGLLFKCFTIKSQQWLCPVVWLQLCPLYLHNMNALSKITTHLKRTYFISKSSSHTISLPY
jgi:hypothetical protein